MANFGRFDPRFYKHPDGYDAPSATTILTLLDKPALRQWAANCVVEYIRDNCAGSAPVIGEYIDYIVSKEVLDDARFAYKGISKEARDTGTDIHELCQLYLEGLSTTGVAKQLEALLEESSENIRAMFNNFVKWCEKHNVVLLALEQDVYGNGYAGRIDLVCEIDPFWDKKLTDRVITLIDFKTGKAAYYPEWGLQTASYRDAYNRTKYPADDHVYYNGVLKFSKETLRVNYKDYSKTYEKDLKSFLCLKDFYWLQCIKEKKNVERRTDSEIGEAPAKVGD